VSNKKRNALWALSRMTCPSGPMSCRCSSAFNPDLASAIAMIPGMMKMNTGSNLKKAAAIVRAVLRFHWERRACAGRCTDLCTSTRAR